MEFNLQQHQMFGVATTFTAVGGSRWRTHTTLTRPHTRHKVTGCAPVCYQVLPTGGMWVLEPARPPSTACGCSKKHWGWSQHTNAQKTGLAKQQAQLRQAEVKVHKAGYAPVGKTAGSPARNGNICALRPPMITWLYRSSGWLVPHRGPDPLEALEGLLANGIQIPQGAPCQ